MCILHPPFLKITRHDCTLSITKFLIIGNRHSQTITFKKVANKISHENNFKGSSNLQLAVFLG